MTLTDNEVRRWNAGENIKDIKKPNVYIPPKIKPKCINEQLYAVAKSYCNFLTDNTSTLLQMAKLIDQPVVIFDYNNKLQELGDQKNTVYYGVEYKKANVESLIENRASRQENKADHVTIIINSLNDYKIDLNYILKRGAISGVNVLAVVEELPKKHNFKITYFNGVLSGLE